MRRPDARGRSSPNWTGTSSARTTPSGPWPSPSAIAGGGSSLPSEMRQEVAPKNIMMIGPTGVGKTEIARRLAKLTGAPFIKVEATKYTEVGYYGRDVESMVRELVENAIGLVREQERAKRRGGGPAARRGAAARPAGARPAGLRRRARQPRFARALRADPREDAGHAGRRRAGRARRSSCTVEQKAVPMMFTGMGMEQMDIDLQGMFEKIMPKHTSAPRDDRGRGPQRALRAGVRRADQPGEGQRRGDRAGREPGHHLRRRDRQDRGQRADARGRRLAAGRAARPAADRRRAPRCRPATATSGPTTSCSSPPGRSTAPSRAT